MQVDYVKFNERHDRTQYMFSTFRDVLKGKILDVGCDQAPLKKMLPDCDYTGIDMSGTPDIQLNLEKVEALPFEDHQFNCVICIDVLEHLDNLHHIFQELLRVSGKYLIISLPCNYCAARIPILRGHGTIAHYGLPVNKPLDRHKWFFSYSEALHFLTEHAHRNNLNILQQRVCEKPKNALLHLTRILRYPNQEHYLNRYSHTLWTLLEKTPAK